MRYVLFAISLILVSCKEMGTEFAPVVPVPTATPTSASSAEVPGPKDSNGVPVGNSERTKINPAILASVKISGPYGIASAFTPVPERSVRGTLVFKMICNAGVHCGSFGGTPPKFGATQVAQFNDDLLLNLMYTPLMQPGLQTYKVTVVDINSAPQNTEEYTFTFQLGVADLAYPLPTVNVAPPAGSKRIFVTSFPTYTDDLGGLAGADALCTRVATLAHLGAHPNFKALLSDTQTNARDRLDTSSSYVNLNPAGFEVVAGPGRLFSGDPLEHLISYTERFDPTTTNNNTPEVLTVNAFSQGLEETLPLTGSDALGNKYAAFDTASTPNSSAPNPWYFCNDWKKGPEGFGTYGTAGSYLSLTAWAQHTRFQNGAYHCGGRLYCVEQ